MKKSKHQADLDAATAEMAAENKGLEARKKAAAKKRKAIRARRLKAAQDEMANENKKPKLGK